MGGAKKRAAPESEESSRAAGACVLVLLAGVVIAAAFAVDRVVGVLVANAVGGLAVWRLARRMSVSSATPPPEEGRPSCSECAGHELVSVTPLEGQKGMLIYTSAAPDSPNHTHIHIVGEVTDR